MTELEPEQIVFFAWGNISLRVTLGHMVRLKQDIFLYGNCYVIPDDDAGIYRRVPPPEEDNE